MSEHNWKHLNLILVCGVCAICIIIILYYGGYWLYSERYYPQIKSLKKEHSIKPIVSMPNVEWLESPLSKFYINTSHNTYLSFLQHGSFVKPENVRKALEAGARCIEIDISGIKKYPIVAHGEKNMITTSYVKLETMFDEVVKHGFKTSDPLILCLEIFDTSNVNNINQVRNLLISKFGKRLFRYNHGFNGNINIEQVPIRDLLNKVVVLSTYTPILHDVNDLPNHFIDVDNESTIAKTNKQTGKLSRIYMHEGLESYLSMNFNPVEYWKRKHNMIALNFQMKDANLYKNFEFFKDYSFRHMDDPDVAAFLS